MHLPSVLAHYLASQARVSLQTGFLDSKERDTAQRTLAKLKYLAAQGKLRLDEDQVVDLAVLFPGECRNILSNESTIPIQSLKTIVNALADSFSTIPKNREDIQFLRIRAACFECLLYSTTAVVTESLVDRDSFLDDIIACYNGLNKASKILGGGKWNLNDPDPEPWKIQLLRAKLSILSVLNCYFSCLSDSSARFIDKIVEGSFKMTKDAQDGNFGHNTPFVDHSLISDFERMYQFTVVLRNIKEANDDPRLDLLLEILKLSPGIEVRLPGGLQLLPIPKVHPRAMAVRKDKGKEKVSPETEDISIQSQIMNVHSILPELPVETIRSCLEDSRYAGDISRVVDVLLDGYTAPGMLKPAENMRPAPIPSNAYIKDRRNIFDSESLDVTKLRIGKQSVDSSEIDHAMKFEILRRVEEMSSEDEYSVDGEGLDIEDQFTRTASKVADGEDSSDEESSDSENKADAKPTVKNIDTILELAYLNDQSIFARDANTRRGKAREELKRTTGWTDEQIEGWRIMLERNPHKERILQKHEFSGNKSISSEMRISSGTSTRTRGGHRGRGRVDGSGSGSGGLTNQQDKDHHARNERNKTRRANRDRKRGYDKKMARGGLPS